MSPVLEEVKKYFKKTSGIDCKFEFEQQNNTECILYLDSDTIIDQNKYDDVVEYRVSGAVFVINATDKCSLNDAFLFKLSNKIKAQFDSRVIVGREGTYVKYSIAYTNLTIKEKPCETSNGIITEVYYTIGGN